MLPIIAEDGFRFPAQAPVHEGLGFREDLESRSLKGGS